MSEFGGPLASGILLIGLIGSLTILFPVFISENSIIGKYNAEYELRLFEKSRTNFTINNVSITIAGNSLNLTVTNTGQEIIRYPEKLTVLSDIMPNYWLDYGEMIPGWQFTLIPTVYNPGFWDPGEDLVINITLSLALDPGYYIFTVASLNGIIDSYQWFYT